MRAVRVDASAGYQLTEESLLDALVSLTYILKRD